MVDFSHLAALEIPNAAKKYLIDRIPGEAITLHLLPASESNKPYWNAALRIQNKRLRGGSKKAQIDDVSVQKNRGTDKSLIAAHCLVGWEGVKDADGNDVPFTKENGVDFIAKLPGWLFDPIKQWTADPDNYIDSGPDLDDDDIDDAQDAAELGKS